MKTFEKQPNDFENGYNLSSYIQDSNEKTSEYSNQENYIDYLEGCLYKQRLINALTEYKTINYSSHEDLNNFLKTKTDNKYIQLNIAGVEINFKFDFQKILQKLGCTEQDKESGKIICPYEIYCGAVFNQEAYFCSLNFSQVVNFENSTFNQIVSFGDSVFNKSVYFEKVAFNQEAYFWIMKFNGEENNSFHFYDIKLNSDKSYISFRDINYNEKNKQFTESENSKIAIINTVINGRIEFNNVAINEIDFEGSVVIGAGIISTDELNVKKYATWKTARFLKHEAYKISNTIEALKYKAIEKKLYSQYLKYEKKDYIKSIKDTTRFSKMRYYGERFSLWLSNISNNHGQSWLQAVIFTILSSLLFFSLANIFINEIDLYSIKNIFTSSFLKNYLNYLNPANFDLMKNINQTYSLRLIPFGFFYILGKISLGYGIVEIVQAFRKFNAKGN